MLLHALVPYKLPKYGIITFLHALPVIFLNCGLALLQLLEQEVHKVQPLYCKFWCSAV